MKKFEKWHIAMFLAFLLLFFTMLLVINFGRADIKITDIIRIIIGRSIKNPLMVADIPLAKQEIIWSIRMPRILAAIIVGGGLAVSGAVFQALLLNPLADSYTMGVSTGAAFFASIAIYLNITFSNFIMPVSVFAFIGAIFTLFIVIKIAKVKGYISSSNLVIAGIIVGSILSAGISFIKSAAGEEVGAIVSWLMGSFCASSWQNVISSFFVVSICTLICFYFSNDLNVMSLGDREARYLGIDVDKMRKVFLICGSLITAICVSVSGIIGFVGLIIPHMLRFVFGSDNRKLIPLCALFGGELLVLSDTTARVLMNVEIPVGVLTTLLGGPFFIFIFIRKNSSIQ